MLSKNSGLSGPAAPSRPAPTPILLSPKQAARLLNLSVSWFAKRRLAGDGPPYIKLGGAFRYAESSLQQWIKTPSVFVELHHLELLVDTIIAKRCRRRHPRQREIRHINP